MQKFILTLELPEGAEPAAVMGQLTFSRKSGIRLVSLDPFIPPQKSKPAPGAGLVKRFRIHVKSASAGDRDYLVFGCDEAHARAELQKAGYNGRIASVTQE